VGQTRIEVVGVGVTTFFNRNYKRWFTMKTKYEPLEIFLKNQSRSTFEVSLSFKQIEAIISNKLPISAYQYRAWWGNQRDTSNRPQAKSWLDAGFEVETVTQSTNSGSVVFRRMRSR
jgi:hypothetical protein